MLLDSFTLSALRVRRRTKSVRGLGGFSLSRKKGNEKRSKPYASEVLTAYLTQTNEPPWTSYFVRFKDVINDQYGMSYFNWRVGESNYAVLRIGCFPYIKYHCTKSPVQDLDIEDRFYRIIKVLNLGIPAFLYGLSAVFLIRHKEIVHTKYGDLHIYFLMKENIGSKY